MPPKSVAQRKKIKGGKKKQIDPFLKKEWYIAKIPLYLPSGAMLTKDNKDTNASGAAVGAAVAPPAKHRIGYTPAKKSGAKKQLDCRTFIVNLADLQEDPYKNDYPDLQYKKYRFIAEDTYGTQVLTQWVGMEITRDKRCSLIRKWRSMIECLVDAKTTDGYVLRIKALAFTNRQPTQVKKNCYAKRSQIRRIRARMCEIIKNHVSSGELKDLIKKLSDSVIGQDIQKACQLIFPLNPKACLVEKVKVMRKPKKDVAKLMEIHDLEATFDVEMVEEAAADADDEDGDDDDDDDDDGDEEVN